ncbi:hypothetical protein ASPZODRAFT_14520 [Penicilliopsis zonata CBS 506.65]|uniref:Uncharacterized protein n=1 Tax=Penicilliopsis zonata CBS 506.65 TaxID=1073090 RepID=A0A1L9SMP2_9EURO|nr:hypothetical protein ASPZODRAFT_14520 [Penicilliopsis zonata CBS 506.65]OJJ48383.1 hypothetical protein ASPZODRAFT_14520 [Penicilliopsis zonata CBS 506.65]
MSSNARPTEIAHIQMGYIPVVIDSAVIVVRLLNGNPHTKQYVFRGLMTDRRMQALVIVVNHQMSPGAYLDLTCKCSYVQNLFGLVALASMSQDATDSRPRVVQLARQKLPQKRVVQTRSPFVCPPWMAVGQSCVWFGHHALRPGSSRRFRQSNPGAG